MFHCIEELPRSDGTYPRQQENKDTSSLICWTSKLSLLSLIAAINSNIYQQQKRKRAENKVAKSLLKIARDKLAMISLTQVRKSKTLA
jgi:hypothetical protein